jgi:hypothetical protein
MYKYFLSIILIFYFLATAADIQSSLRLIWDDMRLDLHERSQLENHYLVLADSSGDYVCFWEEKKLSDKRCIKALRFSSSFVPKDTVKEIVQFSDNGSFVKIYGSGNGNYLVLFAAKQENLLSIKAIRLLPDLSYRENSFFPVCTTKDLKARLFGTIDNNDMVVIAVHEDNKEDQMNHPTNLRLFYLNRSGLADSINVSTDEQYTFFYLNECMPGKGSKVTLFFYVLKISNINKHMIYSRTISYSSNTLEFKSGYNKIFETEIDAGGADVKASGRYDYPGSMAIVNGTYVPQAKLIYLDSLVVVW